MNPDWRLYTDQQRAVNARYIALFQHVAAQPAPTNTAIDPLIAAAMQDSTVELAAMLQAQVDEYDSWQAAIKNGQPTSTTVARIEDLGVAFIRARKARRWTQRRLGEEIRVKAQQIQYYERTLYAGASIRRCQDVATVLSADVVLTVSITPTPTPGGD